jgi:hypothetical protein
MGAYLRGHWSLDVLFREDGCQAQKETLAKLEHSDENSPGPVTHHGGSPSTVQYEAQDI